MWSLAAILNHTVHRFSHKITEQYSSCASTSIPLVNTLWLTYRKRHIVFNFGPPVETLFMPNLLRAISVISASRIGLVRTGRTRYLRGRIMLSGLIVSGVASPCTPSWGTPSTDEEVLRHRGEQTPYTQNQTPANAGQPTLSVVSPIGGWTTSPMILVKGRCSDSTVNPVQVIINGAQYFVSPTDGEFSRPFPAAQGRNTVTISCVNKSGSAQVTRSLYAQTAPIPLKFILTSDTDGVYTDLHIYEPEGDHIYWAQTNSKTGGLFFLNSSEGSFDKPGYGPYLYVHPAPPKGVYRIDANYWPGGAIQHTLASLEVVTDEGTPREAHRRIRKPLARPGETATLAYVYIRGDGKAPQFFVPGQDTDSGMPEAVRNYIREHPSHANQSEDTYARLSPEDNASFRESVAEVALAQQNSMNPRWNPSQRDCAGLVRFAYREAMKPRSDQQRIDLQLPQALAFPPVSVAARMHFPEYPSLWRSGGGTYQDFADARTLLEQNFDPISKNVSDAESADVIAYRRSLAPEDVLHLMLAVRRPSSRALLAVYHSGAAAPEGQVRIVQAESLFAADDPTWRPVPQNPHFLGVYRWKPLLN